MAHSTSSEVGITNIKQDGTTVITLEPTTTTIKNNLVVEGTSGMLGIGQTWQDLTAERDRNIEYTNTTGKPIMVVVSCTAAGSSKFMLVDNVPAGQINNGPTYASSTTIIVPAGSTYKMDSTTATSIKWSELR